MTLMEFEINIQVKKERHRKILYFIWGYTGHIT